MYANEHNWRRSWLKHSWHVLTRGEEGVTELRYESLGLLGQRLSDYSGWDSWKEGLILILNTNRILDVGTAAGMSHSKITLNATWLLGISNSCQIFILDPLQISRNMWSLYKFYSIRNPLTFSVLLAQSWTNKSSNLAWKEQQTQCFSKLLMQNRWVCVEWCKW